MDFQVSSWNARLIFVFLRIEHEVSGYVVSDFTIDLDKRRSLTSHHFTIGGSTMSWKATLQPSIAFFNTKAKYVTLEKQLKWPFRFIDSLVNF